MTKSAPKGSSEKFLLDHAGYQGDDCIDWPFRGLSQGYGLAVVGGVQKRASRWMCIIVHGDAPFHNAQAAHSCGRPICVSPRHLRWATPKSNSGDKKIHGTTIHGERSGKTKLTAEDVAAIRNAPPDLTALMARFGVSKGCLSKIRSGQRWPHTLTENGVVFHEPEDKNPAREAA